MCQVVKKSRSYVTFFKMIINIVVIIIINNKLFSTHTHVCEFITSKTSWYTKTMACHIIITWKIELLLITKGNNISTN